MTVADLARWFDRPDATVRSWVHLGHTPTGGPADQEEIEKLLVLLEKLIRVGHKPLPFPTRSSRIWKKVALAKLRDYFKLPTSS